MSKIGNYFRALVYDGELSKARVYQRLNCIEEGHSYRDSVLLEKLTSEGHPHSDAEYLYTINLRQCFKCGLVYQDAGLEFRKDK